MDKDAMNALAVIMDAVDNATNLNHSPKVLRAARDILQGFITANTPPPTDNTVPDTPAELIDG